MYLMFVERTQEGKSLKFCASSYHERATTAVDKGLLRQVGTRSYQIKSSPLKHKATWYMYIPTS